MPKSDVWGGGTLSCDLSHDTCDVPTPPLDRMTDTCENITFPKLFFLIFVGHMSIFGATDTPVSDFW